MKKFLALLVLAACNESPTAPEPVPPPPPPVQADSVLAPGFFDLTSPEWRIAFGHSWFGNNGAFTECHWTGSLRIQQQNGGDFTGSIVHVGATCFDPAIGFVPPPNTGMVITNGRIDTIIGDITQITFDLQIGSLPVCPMKLQVRNIALVFGADCQTRPMVLYR